MMQEISADKMSHPSTPTTPAKGLPKTGSSNSLSKQLKKLDVYPKIDENYRVQTSAGAIISLIGWFVISVLLLAEIKNYIKPTFKEHMIVDTSFGQFLRVNLNISFHALTCAEVHLDAMDVAGDNQLNIEHEMMKQRIAKSGELIGEPGVEIIGQGDIPAESIPENYCGPCYGAETEILKCCNTCNELIRAYEAKQWNPDFVSRNSTQCIRDRALFFSTVHSSEGCRIIGSMKVNKVAGNFHVAFGESIVRDGKHIHQFNPALAPQFNISHTIHSLSFGDPYPSMPPNPLDSVRRIIPSNGSTGLFQYFIKVIPTIYTNENGYGIQTNQYTITDRFRPLSVPKIDPITGIPQLQVNEAILPGIFFIYDLSPFMIEASRSRTPLLHLLTKVCAIVGGVFSVLGVIDSILFQLQKMSSSKKK